MVYCRFRGGCLRGEADEGLLMLLRIIKHEWRDLTADRTVWLIAVVFATLIGYGVFNGASWVNTQRERAEKLIRQQEEKLAEERYRLIGGAGQSASDTYALGVSLQYATLPFTPAAVLSVGQSDLLSATAGVSVLSLQRTQADKTGFENPLSFLAGRFDLSFTIVYLFPLFILALSYNLLSGEREQGTLQLLLSQPVSLKSIALGKAALRALVIFGLVAPLSLIGLILSGADWRGAGFLSRLLLWIMAVVAYGAFWFALALMVNATGASSATNAVALAACWLLFSLIVPSLLNVAVSSLYPIPSRAELITALRDVNLDMRRDGGRLLSEFYQDHPELMPEGRGPDVNDLGLAFVTIQQEHKRRTGEVEARFELQLAKQQQFVNLFRFLSPAVVMQEALNEIAGTGLPRYQRFRQQVAQHDRRWTEFFLPRIYKNAKLTAADYDAAPRFRFVEEPSIALARRAGVSLVGLLLPTLLIGALGLRALKKYSTAHFIGFSGLFLRS
jgi:ABC-2 type transport system permease protein